MSMDNIGELATEPGETPEQPSGQDPKPTWGPSPTGPMETLNDENMEVENKRVEPLTGQGTLGYKAKVQ
ncbi:hypothetical protein Aduo_002991 [Ancylostoma duodenale]